ncbi:hypothetical protein M752DRAFT_284429 [Aspergillus phoenicis ATCC 13157]|uniref:Uncharacterized protein n=1 Tax=Aspergillus phoenicis ATCC 13157 TaxID=1353007 RepID=A0A370PHR4_ASPPH|nr:hypothetical protein M752DRAFT_284429 [Aspergillus phoenicis ATCC 13157]
MELRHSRKKGQILVSCFRETLVILDEIWGTLISVEPSEQSPSQAALELFSPLIMRILGRKYGTSRLEHYCAGKRQTILNRMPSFLSYDEGLVRSTSVSDRLATKLIISKRLVSTSPLSARYHIVNLLSAMLPDIYSHQTLLAALVGSTAGRHYCKHQCSTDLALAVESLMKYARIQGNENAGLRSVNYAMPACLSRAVDSRKVLYVCHLPDSVYHSGGVVKSRKLVQVSPRSWTVAGKPYMAIKDYHQSGGMVVLPLMVAMRSRVDGGAYCRDFIGVVIFDYFLHVFVLYLVGDTHNQLNKLGRWEDGNWPWLLCQHGKHGLTLGLTAWRTLERKMTMTVVAHQDNGVLCSS